MQDRIVLIYPPLAKACEPPAGITRIAGFLRGNKQKCTLWDANLEAQLFLLSQKQQANDTWSKRAWKNRLQNLKKLRSEELYKNLDRYQQAVRDTNRVLSKSCTKDNITISLANYQENNLSTHKSSDLIHAAQTYQDSCFYPFFETRLADYISHPRQTIIGISLNYLSQAFPAFSLAGLIREEYPECRLIVGGGLITSWLRSPGWKNPFGDLFSQMIAGPGEPAILRLLGHTEEIVHQVPRFDGLPLTDYLAPGTIIPYSASTGCYWNRCSFCPERAEGSKYVKTPSSQVVQDLTKLKQEYRPRLVHFLDNAIAPSLMKQLIKEPIGLDWYGFARISKELADPHFCRQLRESGCVMLKLGIESGSQDVLDEMDKGINLHLVEQCFRNLHKAGIATYIYLLFGTPAENYIRAKDTLHFTVRNAGTIGFLNLAVFNLPHNSHEKSRLQIRNFSSGDLGLYSDFIHPQGWNRKEVQLFLAQEFKTHPAIRPILHRDPPFFTSNHAPFIMGLAHQENHQHD